MSRISRNSEEENDGDMRDSAPEDQLDEIDQFHSNDDEESDGLEEEIVREIEALPRERRDQVISYIERTIKSHSGPLPNPESLAEYDRIIPDGAERIMQMAEKEGDHRRNVHREIVRKSFGLKFRGQIFGFIIALSTLGMGGFLVHEGHEIGGTLFGLGGVGSLVAVFVTGKLAKNKEDEDEDE